MLNPAESSFSATSSGCTVSTTKPSSSPGQASFTARAMAAEALPAPTTTVRPPGSMRGQIGLRFDRYDPNGQAALLGVEDHEVALSRRADQAPDDPLCQLHRQCEATPRTGSAGFCVDLQRTGVMTASVVSLRS